ncbi:hypothetical protein [Shouchella miscanthi]|uniref:Uncharacterized protein n=1 Tax=Shouchella miscanthi TaxID=2598861 RepID=A0ABU6NLH9_9BACI|nr:hypothetical protein [Shouchella miscanthi]
MKKIATGFVALFVMAGCGSDMGAFGPGPLNFEHMKHEQDSYPQGQTNLGASYVNPSAEHRTLEQDGQLVEEIIEEHGFRSGIAIVNGGHIYAKAHPDHEWDKAEQEQHTRELEKALERGIPRYQVHLR